MFTFAYRRSTLLLTASLLAFLALPATAAPRVIPLRVELGSPEATQQLLVLDENGSEPSKDLTRSVRYEWKPEGIATIDARGLIRAVKDGATQLIVHHGAAQLAVPVTVTGYAQPRPVSYRNEIVPIMTKARCNSGGCHGKAEGQNGFKLSLFGFDPIFDYDALVNESRGRRITPTTPDQSLVFLKGSARVPHGGGRKIEPGSFRDRLLLR